MLGNNEILNEQLQQACKLSGARWAVWLRRLGETWDLGAHVSLGRSRQEALSHFLSLPKSSTWLAGAFSSGRTRHTTTGEYAEKLGCLRVFIFVNSAAHSLLMVGADALSSESQGFFRILALQDPLDASASQANNLNPSFDNPHYMEPDANYDPQTLYQWLLEYLEKNLKSRAAYLAIRTGDLFRIETQKGYDPQVLGREVVCWEDPVLNQVVSTLQGSLLSEFPAGTQILQEKALPRPVKTSLVLPIVLGDRVLGVAVFISFVAKAFSYMDMEQAQQALSTFAHAVEGAITFREIARNLRHFALLNEITAAAASPIDARQLAQLVVEQLSHIFGSRHTGIYILSSDGKTLHEYGGAPWNEKDVIPVEDSLAGYVAQTGEPIRVDEPSQAPRYIVIFPDVNSLLGVPLKYQGRVIGVIMVSSHTRQAFTVRDEQLLLVVASQLAGLIENLRLLEETEQRASNLDLLHQVILRVVGLTDIKEITQTAAELMAEKFGYEFVSILLPDERHENLLFSGAAGKMAHTLTPGMCCPVEKGVTGRVFRSGRSAIENHVREDPDYYSLTDWQAGSELCLPLQEGGQVLGLIDLEYGEENAFSKDDLFINEALAGILTSVIVNAAHLKELQERIVSQALAEKRLLQSAKLAGLGEMAAGVAHELNNPLTTISGFVQLVLDEMPEDAPWRSDLNMVLEEARRAHRVVRRLLDFSRQSDNTRWDISLNELVESAVGLMAHQAQSLGVEMDVSLAENLPQIRVDPIQIKEVMINLVQNALQAMPNGGQLKVQTEHRWLDSRDGVMASVTDTGEGIAPEIMERIYEPFFTTRPVGKGTGLGLSVSYGLISDHGGRIEVASQVGKGSCFTVWLPALESATDLQPEERA